MSALRQDLDGSPQPELDMRDEMSLIASGRAHAAGDDAWARLLTRRPELAKRLGRKIDRMRAVFANAYPGQTRERTFTNEQWTANGFSYVAKINDLMGRKGS